MHKLVELISQVDLHFILALAWFRLSIWVLIEEHHIIERSFHTVGLLLTKQLMKFNK